MGQLMLGTSYLEGRGVEVDEALALAWIRRADALMAAKQYVPAAREYEHLLNIYPGHPRRPAIELARAVCLMRGGQRL